MKRNPDGSFSGARAGDLTQERENIIKLLRQSCVLTPDQLNEFHNDARYNKDIIKETGNVDRTVDFAIAMIVEDTQLVMSHVRGIQSIDIACHYARAYLHNIPLVLEMWRRFGGPNSDCVTYYLVRKGDDLCEIRYMPHFK
jgi:hypothetical protein